MKEIYATNENLYGKFLHKEINLGSEVYKIGTEINETVLQKILDKTFFEIDQQNKVQI